MSTHDRLADLKDSLETKTRLMQDVAHELKNPLSVIQGYAAYLSKETVSPAELRKALRAILSNAERMNALVGQLQDAVRSEAPGFTIQTRSIESAAVLQEAVESAEHEALRRGVSLRWRSVVSDRLPVAADPGRLMQILANLIGNALKFTPAGGSVDVHAQLDGDFVRFSVIDTGSGIPAEDLPLLFDRFYQVRGAAQSAAGLGLGLAICKCLVEAHGGRIWVESLPDRGSAFHFTIPSASTRASVPEKA